MRIWVIQHIPSPHHPHPPADIAFRALFTDTRARLCSAVALCLLALFIYLFILRAVPRACCSRTTPLGYYCRERRRGMCLGSVGSGLDPRQPHRWLESQSLFLSPSISFSSAPFCLPTIRHAPPHRPHPPCADEDISALVSRGERRISHSVLEECLKGVKICL